MGRASDLAGLQYWANRVASGEMNVGQIAASFTESPEYRGQYQGLSNAALVSKVYTNVIGRSARNGGPQLLGRRAEQWQRQAPDPGAGYGARPGRQRQEQLRRPHLGGLQQHEVME